ncbi:MAG: hypothetical protein ACXVBX_15285 [Flavisolibacter sp.]
MKTTHLFTTLIFIYGCSSQNPKEKEIFLQADKIIEAIKEKDFNTLNKSVYHMSFPTALTDSGWISYASPLVKNYAPLDHKSWRLVKTDMGYEVHIPLLNVQEEDDVDYKSFDFVLFYTPDRIANKFYDFRLDGDLKSARKRLIEAPK